MSTNYSFLVILFLFFSSCQEKIKKQTELNDISNSLEKPSANQIALFNTKNFDGWKFSTRDTTFKGDIYDLFTIENGVIHVLGTPENYSEQTFAGITTTENYSSYKLTLEYKWGDKKFKPRHEFVRDAGVLFHVHGDNVIWPNSVECQIQEGDTGDIWAINTQVTSKVSPVIRNYNPEGDSITRGGKGIKFSRFHRGYDWEKPHGQWNKLELIVEKNNAKYYLNDHIVNEALDMKYYDKEADEMKPLTHGKILLQAEGAEIFYRNIFLEKL